jgi:CRISPR-associated protein Cas2
VSAEGYRYMWLLVFFDLPVSTKSERRNAARFRKFLLADGYVMLQYSVYARPCNGSDAVSKHEARLFEALPKQGHVRAMAITDSQYGRMRIFQGQERKKVTKNGPTQLSFF